MEDTTFAIYRSTETQVRYFNGIHYIVRHEMYPHTTFKPDGVSIARQVTMQGHSIYVGARQGDSFLGGFSVTRYNRPDTTPTRVYRA